MCIYSLYVANTYREPRAVITFEAHESEPLRGDESFQLPIPYVEDGLKVIGTGNVPFRPSL